MRICFLAKRFAPSRSNTSRRERTRKQIRIPAASPKVITKTKTNKKILAFEKVSNKTPKANPKIEI